MPWPFANVPAKTLHRPADLWGGYLSGWSINAGSPANTKGSWTELFTAATRTYTGQWVAIWVDGTWSAAVDRSHLLDIGVGSAGNETVIFPDLLAGNKSAFPRDRVADYVFPLYLPAGQRVVARAASNNAGWGLGLYMNIFGGDIAPGITTAQKVQSYGIDAATSGGVLVTPNTVQGTKGSWTEIASSTTYPIDNLVVGYQGSTAIHTGNNYLVDIAVGSAGNETIVIPDFGIQATTQEIVRGVSTPFTPTYLNIPVGSRLSARASSNGTAVVGIEIALYGLTYGG